MPKYSTSDAEQNVHLMFSKDDPVIPLKHAEKFKHKLKKAKIRGVESAGMICAEDELQLSEDHSGIMVLDPKLQVGTPISEALELNDVIMEIAITPMR